MNKRKAKSSGPNEIVPSQHKPEPKTEQKEPGRILECPAGLGPVARREWNRLISELLPMGVLSTVDRGPLALYCQAFAQWIEAMEMVQKHGEMLKSPNGFPMQSPYQTAANRHADTMMRIASEFGFTPASRSRIFSYSQSESMLLDAVRESHD